MACKTDGSTYHYITIPFVTPSASEWSVCAWAIPRGAGDTPTGSYIINNWGSGASNDSNYISFDNNSKRIIMGIKNTALTGYSGTSGNNTVLLDTLYHFCWTFKQNDYFRCYINASEYYNVGTANVPIQSPAYNVRLASHHNADSVKYNGEQFDVRFYDKQLSVPEVETIYHSQGNDGITDNLYARYLINENTSGSNITGASSVIDISGNSRHASPTSNPVYSEASLKIGR